MGRPATTDIAIKINKLFNITMKQYAEKNNLKYNSLKMYASGIYNNHKAITQQLLTDGVIDARPN